jgi:hypothetical protein
VLADFLFAGHATVATLITLAQFVTFQRAAQQQLPEAQLSSSCKVLLGCITLGSGALLLQARAVCADSGGLDCPSWLMLLSWLGGIKVGALRARRTRARRC